MEYSV
jgi:hypothetical protein